MFSFLAFGGTLAGGNPTLYGRIKNQNAWVDVFGLDCSQEILRNIGYLQGRKKEEIIDELKCAFAGLKDFYNEAAQAGQNVLVSIY